MVWKKEFWFREHLVFARHSSICSAESIPFKNAILISESEGIIRVLVNRKGSLALREVAFGVEGLKRFIRKEPLRRIHESVFGVLALESEDVAPRYNSQRKFKHI